jgi:putative ABC transport system substrate-binding protein
MRRRDFINGIAGSTVVWSCAAHAQQLPIVGVLIPVSMLGDDLTAFRQGLGETDFTDGRNVTIEEHATDGQYDRLPALAADLVRRNVAVIAADTTVAALAAKAATNAIPIVFRLGSDPVKDGLVANLARPGGNITGVTFFSNLLTAKRLELLHDIVPNTGVTGLLVNPGNPNAEREMNDARTAAQTLGLRLAIAQAATADAIDAAFAEFVRQQVTTLLVAADNYLNVDRAHQIAALALRHAIAACVQGRSAVAAGGLVSYGASRVDAARQLGIYVGRVLKGEMPGDLPVVQPTKFEIIINLITAKAIGVTINREVLLRADEVIE